MKLKNFQTFLFENVYEMSKVESVRLDQFIKQLKDKITDSALLNKMKNSISVTRSDPYMGYEDIVKFILHSLRNDGFSEDEIEDLASNAEVELKESLSVNESETFNDYPESARNAARKAIKWKEEHGKEVKAGTAVGWTRARQLANGENLSMQTIKRMKAFFDRHEKNKSINSDYKGQPWKDNGYVAWLIWGGDGARTWAERKIKQYEKAQLQKTIREEFQSTLNETDLSIRQKINRFTKEVKALGAPNFYINPTVKGSDKYLRKFYVNTTDGEKDWAAVRKWIMSHPEAHKKVGVGVDNYSYMDNQNRLSYSGYSNGGYYYLSIESK